MNMESFRIMSSWFGRWPHPLQSAAVTALLLIWVVAFQKLFIFLYKRLVKRWMHAEQRKWGLFFTDRRFIFWLSFLPTPIYLYFGLYSVPHFETDVVAAIQRCILCFLIWAGLRTLAHGLRIVDVVYRQYPMAASRPIKGYLQTASMAAHFVGIISIVALLLDRSPWVFLSGLGAMTAILLLVFKESILSLVAGIQITTNDLIRVGDWIEMPQFNADGDVVDIALHSVTVQNWDKTVTYIPAHKFLENAFKNWRGMFESGGRRIKRAVRIDARSIRFLTPEDIERFRRYRLLHDYLDRKIEDIGDANRRLGPDAQEAANTRRLTNVGTFRHYLRLYLRSNPHINQHMTFLVRQLDPTAEGLPIEIYVFTNDTRWTAYEDIQADIFDHVLAILPEFGLRYFQNPAGSDFAPRVPMGPFPGSEPDKRIE